MISKLSKIFSLCFIVVLLFSSYAFAKDLLLMEAEGKQADDKWYALGVPRQVNDFEKDELSIYTADKFEKIIIQNDLDGIEGAIHSWDVLASGEILDSGDTGALAWTKEASTDGLYNLYIGGDGNLKAPINMNNYFREYTNLKSIEGLECLDTSNAEQMGYLFANDKNLEVLDLSSFNTENAINMPQMFNGCSKLDYLNISTFDTSKVKSMSMMFSNTSFTTLDLTNFDTSSLENVFMMFSGCKNLTTILIDRDKFVTDNVKTMERMFYNCNKLKYFLDNAKSKVDFDLGNWNTENVTNMKEMFFKCTEIENIDLSSFDTSNVENMLGMFNLASGIKMLDLRNFSTSKVTNMDAMFKNCKALSVLVLGENFNLLDGNEMFLYATATKGIISLDKNAKLKINNNESGELGIGSRVLYVVDEDTLDTYKADEEFAANFKKPNYIKMPLQLVDDDVIYVSGDETGEAKYEDLGVTAFGIDTEAPDENDDLLNEDLNKAGFTLKQTKNNVNLQIVNNKNNPYEVEYTLYYNDEIVQVITRKVHIKRDEAFLMERGDLEYALGVKRAIDAGDYNLYKYRSENIEKIVFQNGFDGKELALNEWDISDNLDKSIIAWGVQGSSADKYIIYVGAQDSMVAPSNFENYFRNYINLVEIEGLDKIDTSSVTRMGYMFKGDKLITSIDLSSFDTSNVKSMIQMFNNCSKLESVDLSSFDTSKVTDMSMMFAGADLHTLDLSNFNTSSLTTASMLFSNNANLTKIIIDKNKFTTSNVTNMYMMFYACASLKQFGSFNVPEGTLDLSGFDTSKVTNMQNMFYKCKEATNIDLSSFDTSNVENMSGMFNQCSKLEALILTNFSTKSVTQMKDMFQNCKELKALVLGDKFGLLNGQGMFLYDNNLTGIISTITDKENPLVISLESGDMGIFKKNFYVMNEDLLETYQNNDSFTAYFKNVSNIQMPLKLSGDKTITIPKETPYVDAGYIAFSNSDVYSSILSKYGFNIEKTIDNVDVNTPNSTKNPYIVEYTLSYNDNVVQRIQRKVNVQRDEVYLMEREVVKPYEYPIGVKRAIDNGNSSLSIYKSNLIEKIIIQNSLAQGDEVIASWDISKDEDESAKAWIVQSSGDEGYVLYMGGEGELVAPSNMQHYFRGYTNLKSIEGLEHIDTSASKLFAYMFLDDKSITNLDLSSFDTSKSTTIAQMFNGCVALENVDLSSFDTSNVTDMNMLFNNDNALLKLDLSNFDTSNVKNMSRMFYSCKALDDLDISNFNTSSVTTMSNMFANCKSLKKVDVSNFDTSKVTEMTRMFYAGAFETLDLRSFNLSLVENMDEMFTWDSSLKSIIIDDSFNKLNGLDMFKDCKKLKIINLNNDSNKMITISGDINLNQNVLFYVVNEYMEEAYENEDLFKTVFESELPNYEDISGDMGRIRTILSLSGDSKVTIELNDSYEDEGAFVFDEYITKSGDSNDVTTEFASNLEFKLIYTSDVVSSVATSGDEYYNVTYTLTKDDVEVAKLIRKVEVKEKEKVQVKGDVDNSGGIDIIDVRLNLQAVINESKDLKYDFNGDGEVDIIDVRLLLQDVINKS